MTTPPESPGLRSMRASGVCLRTFLFLTLFASTLTAASVEHQKALRWMKEAQQTSNPVRLFLLAMDIREALGKALKSDPEDLDVRLDLVRFHTVTPRIAGGDLDEARAQAAEIARRDAPLGHFASGYIAYREKEFGVARHELQ